MGVASAGRPRWRHACRTPLRARPWCTPMTSRAGTPASAGPGSPRSVSPAEDLGRWPPPQSRAAGSPGSGSPRGLGRSSASPVPSASSMTSTAQACQGQHSGRRLPETAETHVLWLITQRRLATPRRAGTWPERGATASRKPASGALREARSLVLLAWPAHITRRIAVMALIAPGFRSLPFHDPFHGPGLAVRGWSWRPEVASLS